MKEKEKAKQAAALEKEVQKLIASREKLVSTENKKVDKLLAAMDKKRNAINAQIDKIGAKLKKLKPVEVAEVVEEAITAQAPTKKSKRG